MQVQVYADIACPWCRLGFHRFHRALAGYADQQEIEILHRPFELDPQAATEPRPLMDVMAELFGAEQAVAAAEEMTRLGAGEGLEYRFDRARAVNTFHAHRLLWLTLRDEGAARQAALATTLYDLYFREGANVADVGVLTRAAVRVGMDGERVERTLASDEGSGEVRAAIDSARRDGISRVPTFVFPNGDVLSGAVTGDTILETLRKAGIG